MRLGQASQIAKGESWLIPRYYQYLKNRDPAKEGEWVARILQRPDRIRTSTFSASATGDCGRKRQFAYLKFLQRIVDEKTANIFHNGEYTHLRHQAAGLTAGYLTGVEVPVSVSGLNLSGTMDGVMSNRAIAEFKSINSYGFSQVNTFGPKAEHKNQVNAYMMASGTEAAHILYENKDNNTLKEFIIPRDETKIQEIVTELEELNEATNEKTFLPMLQECKNQEGKWRFCPFASVCETARWPGQLVIQPTFSSEES